jgi:PhnB protein
MSKKIPRPEGHHVVVPSAVVPGAARVIGFLERAFGGKVVDRYEGPGGVVFHAEVLLGDSVVMLGEASDEHPAAPANLSYYVEDADAVQAVYARALDAGGRSVSAPATQPWGYRSACVTDPGENRWTICAIVEELSHDEIVRRMQQAAPAAG